MTTRSMRTIVLAVIAAGTTAGVAGKALGDINESIITPGSACQEQRLTSASPYKTQFDPQQVYSTNAGGAYVVCPIPRESEDNGGIPPRAMLNGVQIAVYDANVNSHIVCEFRTMAPDGSSYASLGPAGGTSTGIGDQVLNFGGSPAKDPPFACHNSCVFSAAWSAYLYCYLPPPEPGKNSPAIFSYWVDHP